MLTFNEETMKIICSHAQNEYPKECCGIILGKRIDGERIAYRVVRTGNMTAEGRNTINFLINPLDIAAAEISAESDGLEIIGFYHSHPDYEAVVSKTDVLYMIEGYSYLIISVADGNCVNEKSFEITAQQNDDVREENISIKEK